MILDFEYIFECIKGGITYVWSLVFGVIAM